MTHIPAPHIVVDQLDLHALSSLVDERIGEQHAQRILSKDIHIDMDMALGLGDLCQKCGKEVVAVAIDRDLIILEGEREILVDEEVDELTMLFGQLQVLLFDELQHRTFGKLVEAPLADEPLLAGVQAEEEVEHQAYYRHEPYHQRPGHPLGRLAIVHHHVDDGQNDNHLIEAE